MSKSELRRLNIQLEEALRFKDEHWSAMEDKIAQLEAELAKQKQISYDLAMGEAELVGKLNKLEAELAAHKENEGDECPVCVLEAENQRLREWVKYSVKFLPDHIYFVNEKGHESEISKAWRKLPQDLRDALKEGG